MRGVSRKYVVLSLMGLVLAASGAANAGVNPFKKSKNYEFGADVPWYRSDASAMKSGSVRDGADTNYYHLKIDKHRLMLRLGKNDPSGELRGTRILESLTIVDVMADGRRLPIFDWCLKNQQAQSKKLKQNAVVVNDVCANGSDFIINLDDKTRVQFENSKTLSIVIEPYGRPVKLIYNMTGYAPLMAKINKPVPPVVVKKTAVAKPELKVKIKAKPKPVVKPEVVKMCKVTPPVEFQKAILALSYPCGNKAKKSDAEDRIAVKVKKAKQKKLAKLKASKQQQKINKRKLDLKKKQEAEWDNKQAALWISRCQRHWKKGDSPCYCEKYLDQAPAGVSSTCIK